MVGAFWGGFYAVSYLIRILWFLVAFDCDFWVGVYVVFCLARICMGLAQYSAFGVWMFNGFVDVSGVLMLDCVFYVVFLIAVVWCLCVSGLFCGFLPSSGLRGVGII